MTYLIHSIPGRFRIASPMVKGDVARAADARAFLLALDGVREVACRPRTGSIIVHYDPLSIGPDALFHALMLQGFIFPLSRRLYRRPALVVSRAE